MAQTVVRINQKGQITIPNVVRRLLFKRNQFVSLTLTPDGRILLTPVEVKEKNLSYTQEEWKKIGHLALQEGKVCKSTKSAKKHLKSL